MIARGPLGPGALARRAGGSLVAASVVAVAALAGCTSDGGGEGTVIEVSSTDDACELSAATAPPGPVTFAVTNDGTRITEFYLYAADGTEVVGEVEDIGPSTSRDLTVELEAGDYVSACKPGMEGDGLRADFLVADA